VSGDGWGEATEQEVTALSHAFEKAEWFLREHKIKQFCFSTDLELILFPRNALEFARSERDTFLWVKSQNEMSPEWIDYVGTRFDGFRLRINLAERIPAEKLMHKLTLLFPNLEAAQ